MTSISDLPAPASGSQLDLDFQPRTIDGEFIISPDEVQWLIDRLRGHGWVTAQQLGADTEIRKRKIRAIAESAGGAIVSYPGSPGYKLLDACTLKELQHGDRAMRSQLRRMAAKWKPIWRRMHHLQLVEQRA
jgi:hypothetical protein